MSVSVVWRCMAVIWRYWTVIRCCAAGHWVKASGVPWMATTDTAYRQPAPLESAMQLDGLVGIVGAGRVKPTLIPDPRAQQELITPNQGHKQAFHGLDAGIRRRKDRRFVTFLPQRCISGGSQFCRRATGKPVIFPGSPAGCCPPPWRSAHGSSAGQCAAGEGKDHLYEMNAGRPW